MCAHNNQLLTRRGEVGHQERQGSVLACGSELRLTCAAVRLCLCEDADAGAGQLGRIKLAEWVSTNYAGHGNTEAACTTLLLCGTA